MSEYQDTTLECDQVEIIKGSPVSREYKFYQFMKQMSDEEYYKVEGKTESELYNHWKDVFYRNLK